MHVKQNGDDIMTQRLQPSTVAPDGVAALVAVEKYLQTCGLDHKLMALVKTRVSQINGCACCLHMHTEEARKLGESDVRLLGGSQSDHWNHALVNQAVNSLWTAHSDQETLSRQYSATAEEETA
jgi:AhpD family alkylhydroperoxidase